MLANCLSRNTRLRLSKELEDLEDRRRKVTAELYQDMCFASGERAAIKQDLEQWCVKDKATESIKRYNDYDIIDIISTCIAQLFYFYNKRCLSLVASSMELPGSSFLSLVFRDNDPGRWRRLPSGRTQWYVLSSQASSRAIPEDSHVSNHYAISSHPILAALQFCSSQTEPGSHL